MFMHKRIVQLSCSRVVRVPVKALVRSIFYSVEDLMQNLGNKAGGSSDEVLPPVEFTWI